MEATTPTSPSDEHKTGWLLRNRLLVIGVVALVAILSLIVYVGLQKPAATVDARTYFTYTDADVKALQSYEPETTPTVADVQKWEDQAYTIVESHNAPDVDASKVYAYLAIAQMDAMALSIKAQGKPAGTIDAVSKDVLCAFYADSCSELLVADDAYSQALANTVMSQIKTRMADDAAQTKPVTLKPGSMYWQGPSPQIGISAPSFKPWFIAKADQFRASPPLDPSSTAVKQELAEVKKALANATNEQKTIVVRWAGGPGTRTPPGIWMTLAADYMQIHNTPLDKYLEVRAILAAAMADAVIGVFDSKYTYQYKRPVMFDPTIRTIMPTPNHPSYPAGHAAISWAAATVLTAYLPDNKTVWEQEANEASDSRTIGGIHLPSDNSAGATMGRLIGNEAIQRWGKP